MRFSAHFKFAVRDGRLLFVFCLGDIFSMILVYTIGIVGALLDYDATEKWFKLRLVIN